MNKHAAKTLRDMRDSIDRAWCEEDVASVLSDAQERYEAIPEAGREGEKAEALEREISNLEELLEAYLTMSEAFSALELEEGNIA